MQLKELAQDRARWCRWKRKPVHRGRIQQYSSKNGRFVICNLKQLVEIYTNIDSVWVVLSIWRHTLKVVGHDVISRIKVLPPGELTRNVIMPRPYAAAYASSWWLALVLLHFHSSSFNRVWKLPRLYSCFGGNEILIPTMYLLSHSMWSVNRLQKYFRWSRSTKLLNAGPG